MRVASTSRKVLKATKMAPAIVASAGAGSSPDCLGFKINMGGGSMAEPMTGSDTQLNAQWARVRGRLRQEFGEATFRSWLKPLTLAGRRGADLRVSVPSRFMRDWVATHYADRLRMLWSNENPEVRTVEVIVDTHRPVPELELDTLDEAANEDAPIAASPVPAT